MATSSRMKYEAPPLPTEVLRIIFSFCDAATLLASARGVCRPWRALINDPAFLPWAKLVLGASLSAPTVGWAPADCTRLLREGVEASRAACVFSAVSRLDCLFAAPAAASAAAVQEAFCAHLRPALLVAESETLAFPDILAEVTGLASAVVPQRLDEVAARCLRRAGSASAQLGFWASAALIFLTATQGSYARAIARWLLELPLSDPEDCANAHEFPYALTALLQMWGDDAGAQSLAADLRSQLMPRVDACLLPAAPGRRLTREQAAVVDAYFAPGDVVKVVAFAGAGKTSTLRALAEAHPEWRILYTAFNASVAADGKQAFAQLLNVTCVTTHVVATPARNALQSAAKKLRTNAMSVKDVCAAFPGYQARDLCPALLAVDTFLVSDAEQVQDRHLPEHTLGNRATIIMLANRMVARMMDPNDAFPFTFNAYLRKFVLSEPRLPYDCILVDEAQDLNPITIRLLLAQAHAVRIFVGDSHQHIYAFNGTRDCLTTLPVTRSFRLSRSFRFGADVAAVADKLLFLKGERTPLRGCRGRDTTVVVSDELQPEHLSGEGSMLGVVRLNVSWIELAAQACQGGASVYIETPTQAKKFLTTAEDVYLVSKGRPQEVSHANKYRLAHYHSLPDLEMEAAESCETDLLILAAFVRKHGAAFPALLQQLRAGCLESPAEARVRLSTCHKAKGCEHDDVFICDDLAQVVVMHALQDGPELRAALHDDLNLLYVAITRARRRVTLPSLLVRRLDTYARLHFAPDIDPAPGAVSACSTCDAAVRGAYCSTMSAAFGAGTVTSRTCAACAARGVGLGRHGALHYALLQHLATA